MQRIIYQWFKILMKIFTYSTFHTGQIIDLKSKATSCNLVKYLDKLKFILLNYSYLHTFFCKMTLELIDRHFLGQNIQREKLLILFIILSQKWHFLFSP